MSKNRVLKIHNHLVEERSLGDHKVVYVNGELSDYDFRHTVTRIKHHQNWRRFNRRARGHHTVKLGDLMYKKLVA